MLATSAVQPDRDTPSQLNSQVDNTKNTLIQLETQAYLLEYECLNC